MNGFLLVLFNEFLLVIYVNRIKKLLVNTLSLGKIGGIIQ